jgi:branched-chain amino acid transport system substrate-binding protein
MKTPLIILAAAFGLIVGANSAFSQKRYDVGASDTEIRIGNTMPYSGPLSAYALIGRTDEAYFRKLNSEGGINGRKINFISYDDAFNPAKTVEQTRKLVESDEVLFLAGSLGTPTSNAVRAYLNQRKIPQLFLATGATHFGDPKNFPWTMGWQPSYQTEGHIFAKYLLNEYPKSKIAVLYQNDDSGKDYLKGLYDGLGGKLPVVAVSPYDATTPTVDSQIVTLLNSGPDVLFIQATPKFATQAIRKTGEMNWTGVRLLASISASVGSVLKPAGLENAKGVITLAYLKDVTDPTQHDDPAVKEWSAFLDTYFPDADKTSSFAVYGYLIGKTVEQVIRQCGDDLTRCLSIDAVPIAD